MTHHPETRRDGDLRTSDDELHRWRVDTSGWEAELTRWLQPFVDALGDLRRRPWPELYMRGLLGTSARKSVEPLTAQVRADLAAHPPTSADTPSTVQYHQLQHFVCTSRWDQAPLETLLVEHADALVGGDDAVLIIDDTTLLKKGHASVGVAHQYSGAAGKQANCQCLVSLTIARREIPVCVSLRLYLPKAWTDDAVRCDVAEVPEARRVHRTKVQIAMEEIMRVEAAGLRFGLVAADAGYGCSAPFRHWLTAKGLTYAVGIQSHQRVYVEHATTFMPRMARKARQPGSRMGTGTFPTGRKRVRRVATHQRHKVGALLKTVRWRTVSWRVGSKGVLSGRFAALRVRVADGAEGRHGAHLPGAHAWLVGEERVDGVRRYYLTNHPESTSVRKLAAAIKSRWSCEHAHQHLKEEFGLDHFEGRKWHGLHHHALLAMLSLAFLQHLRLQTERPIDGPIAPTEPPTGPRKKKR